MIKGKIRFVYMALVGILIFFILHLVATDPHTMPHNELYDLIASIIVTIFVWEGNSKLDRFLNRKFPWQKSVQKRIIVQLFSSSTYTVFVIYISMLLFNKFVCQFPPEQQSKFLITSLVIGLLTCFTILLLDISTQFFGHWKKSLIEIEKYKNETTQSQLQNLKNQINPHFLFNNLSVLSSLVYSDQDKAVDFINQLSKVYRYILENRETELATLESEITFIHSYIFLLQIRFDKNIIFNIDIEDKKKYLLIPPMSLQILVENAIKHNEISSEQPLTISIFIQEEYIIVENNYQLRSNHEPSSKTGLQNIKDRYLFFTTREIEIIQKEKFIVKLPILLAQ